MDTSTQSELDTIALRIHQRRGLYVGLDLGDYQALKEKEREIAQKPEIETVSVEEVFLDFKRNGAEETQLMPKAYLSNTIEESRIAYRFGYQQDLIVYFAIGTYHHNNNWELGLISSHMPGSPGDGGWGSNGHRKLQLVEKPSDKKFDWERWINNTLAWAYEHYDEKVHYVSKGDESLATLLRIAIELERAKK